jgi:hypothetical protein
METATLNLVEKAAEPVLLHIVLAELVRWCLQDRLGLIEVIGVSGKKGFEE